MAPDDQTVAAAVTSCARAARDPGAALVGRALAAQRPGSAVVQTAALACGRPADETAHDEVPGGQLRRSLPWVGYTFSCTP